MHTFQVARVLLCFSSFDPNIMQSAPMMLTLILADRAHATMLCALVNAYLS